MGVELGDEDTEMGVGVESRRRVCPLKRGGGTRDPCTPGPQLSSLTKMPVLMSCPRARGPSREPGSEDELDW